MTDNEETIFHHGYTRQEVVDAIIEFELDNDILPDWREILEYGWAGYAYTDDDVLRELYDEYFVDIPHETPEPSPEDMWTFDIDGDVLDGRGDYV